MFKGKISIIGAGFVGATTAYTVLLGGLASEIVLIDVNKEKAIGEALDMNHCVSYIEHSNVIAGEYSDIKGSDIVVITAGANQKPGETRLDLLQKNTNILKGILNEVTKYCDKDTILLVVSNPVDILTHITYKLSGFSKIKVFGSGTVLDTARLKYSIAKRLNVSKKNVHSYIIGEHGDSELATWSATKIAGLNIDEYCKLTGVPPISKEECYNETKNAAYEIIPRKGATYYGIAVAVRRIIEAIIGNENSILPVSCYLDGEYGIKDICLSVPTIVSKDGASKILELPLADDELKKLRDSANLIQNLFKELNL